MTLWLTHDQARAVADHARRAAPQEACGLIAGVGGRAARIIPIPNAAADPLRRYDMEPAALVRAMFDIQRERLQLIGIYHSHPHSDPVPSSVDIDRAAYPDAAYLIVSLRAPQPQFAAWRIQRRRVERVDLCVGAAPPDADAAAPLSSAGRAAVLMAVAVAFVFLIVLSLALLPPAPPLP